MKQNGWNKIKCNGNMDRKEEKEKMGKEIDRQVEAVLYCERGQTGKLNTVQ